MRRSLSTGFCVASTAVLVLTGLALGSGAQAATLEIFTDKPTYGSLETIFVTVRGTTSGEDPTPFAGVQLAYDAVEGSVNPLCATTGNQDCEIGIDTLSSFSGMGLWSPGGTQGRCDVGANNNCRAFDQVSFASALAVDDSSDPEANTDNDSNPATPGDGSWDAVFSFQATFGTVNFTLEEVEWFGVATPPGVSVLTGVPEPTTATLLALGLGGLAHAHRRRRTR